jgi:hypothetical protein
MWIKKNELASDWFGILVKSLLLGYLCCAGLAMAQSLEPSPAAASNEKESVSIGALLQNQWRFSGSIATNGEYINTSNDLDIREPYQGNSVMALQLGFWEFEAPFYFAISSDEVSKGAELRFLGIQPSYKWFTLYLLDFDLQLSPLFASGSAIRGGGLDVNAQWFQSGFYYGKLFDYSQNVFANYDVNYDSRRYCMAGFLGLNWDDRYQWKVSAMRVADKSLDSNFNADEQIWYTPAENVVAGSDVMLQLFNKAMRIEGEGAISLYTSNIYTQELTKNAQPQWSKNIYTVRLGSVVDYAFTTRYQWRKRLGSLGGFYQYAGPGFTSLAQSTSNADQQTVGTNGQLRLPIIKSAVSGNYRRKQNNVIQDKNSTLTQLQWNAGYSFYPTAWLTTVASYSGNILRNAQNLDSLLLEQDTLERKQELFYTYNDRYMLTANVTHTVLEYSHLFTLSGALQISQKQDQVQPSNQFDTRIVQGGYTFSATKYSMGGSYHLTAMDTPMGVLYLHSVGTNAGYNPQIHWRNYVSASVQMGEDQTGFNVSANSRYIYAANHVFFIQADRIQLLDATDAAREYQEVRGKVGYQFLF